MNIYAANGQQLPQTSLVSTLGGKKDWQHVEELMKENYVQITWNDTKKFRLPVGSYIIPFPQETNPYDNSDPRFPVKYQLFEDYEPEQKNIAKFTYEPHFQHPVMWLDKVPFLLITGDLVSWESALKKGDWSYTGSPLQIATYIVETINWMAANNSKFGDLIGYGWTAYVSSDLSVSTTVSFPNLSIMSAAAQIANAFDCEFHFDFERKQFRLGRVSYGDVVTLKTGVNVGVASISRSRTKFANAFLPKGSTRNLSQPTQSGENVQVTERLGLDESVYPDGVIYTDETGNVVTKSQFDALGQPLLISELIYDDIYPKLELYIYNPRERSCYLLDGNGEKKVDENGNYLYYSKWYIRLAYPVYTTDSRGVKTIDHWEDYHATEDTIIDGTTLGITFLTNEGSSLNSLLAGQGDFDLVYFSKDTIEKEDDDVSPDGFTAHAGDYRIVFKQVENLIIPTTSSGGIYPQALPNGQQSTENNKATLINVVVTDDYKKIAQAELEAAAMRKIAMLRADLNNYELPSNPVAFKEGDIRLHVGQNVVYNDGQDLNGGTAYEIETHIIKLVTLIDYPFVKTITVGNEKVKGALTTLKEQVETLIIGGYGSGSGGSISEEQLNELIKNYADRRYLRKDIIDILQQGVQVGARFVSGLLGEGGIFRKEADGKTYIEADKLYIRMKAYFDTVEFRRYINSGGNRISSPAGGKCVKVEWLDSNGEITDNPNNVVKYRCYFRATDGEGNEVTNDFQVGDQAYCHISNIRNGSLYQHEYWRTVIDRNVEGTLVDGMYWIDLANTSTVTIDNVSYAGYMTGSDVPVEQDSISTLGSKNDSTRRGAIIEYVSGADSPSYKIYQGIGTGSGQAQFSLSNKNQLELGYNSSTGRAYLNVYGDFFFGDPTKDEHNQYTGSYIKYDAGNQSLEIKGTISAKSPIAGTNTDLEQYIRDMASQGGWTQEQIEALIVDETSQQFSDIDTAIQTLQNQADGAIETWFNNGAPTLSNLPASNWNTDALKEKHLGDLYYDNESGYAYRFIKTGNTYSWNQLSDSAVIKALANAAKAQDTADSKRKVFVRQPQNSDEYDEGDFWVNATYPATGTKTYENDILRAVTPKSAGVAFDINHWTKASKYTDDSALEAFLGEGGAFETYKAQVKTQLDGKAETWYQATDPSTEWDDASEHVGDIWHNSSSSTINGVEAGQDAIWNGTSWEVSAVPAAVFNKIDGKASIFINTVANPPSNYRKNDLWILPAAATINGISYIKGELLTATTTSATYNAAHWTKKVGYTNDAKFDSYINQILNGTGATGDSATVANAIRTIRGALNNTTTIDGGLVLTSMIGMKDSSNDIWAGISGQYQANETGDGYKGHGIAAWYGGGMVDKEVSTSATNAAKSLFRFDGSGYLAGGNITWDKNGIVTIANVYSNVDGTQVAWSGQSLQYITNLATLLPTKLQSGVTYLDPKVSFWSLSIQGKAVATQEYVSQNYLSIAFFKRLFQAYNGTTAVNPNNTTASIDNIKAMFGFWTDQYLSALGKNASGGSSGGSTTLAGLTDTTISNPSNGQVLTYSGGKWINKAVSASIDQATLNAALSNYVTLNTAQTISGAKTFTAASLNIAAGTWIQASNGAGLLVYKPSGNSSISSSQWGIGALDAQGVIRSNDNSLIHHRGGTNYTILDTSINTYLRGAINYRMYITSGTDTSNIWHRLGNYTLSDESGDYIILDVFSGDGYNAYPAQNQYARILIKSGWLETPKAENSVGVFIEQHKPSSSYADIEVAVVATGYRTGEVWVLCPWSYSTGNYTISGRFFNWEHNPNYSYDTATPPTSNLRTPINRSVAYKDDNVASATKLQTARNLWGQSFDGTENVKGTITSDYFKLNDTSSNPYLKLIHVYNNTSYNYYVQAYQGLLQLGAGVSKSMKIDSSGNVSITGYVTSTSNPIGTFIGGVTTAVINCNGSGGYMPILNAPTKNGRISLSTYPNGGDIVYLGYASSERIQAGTNSFNSELRWSPNDYLGFYSRGTTDDDVSCGVYLNNLDSTTNQISEARILLFNSHQNNNGGILLLQGTGNLVIGGGEGVQSLANLLKTSTDEATYIAADTAIYLYANCGANDNKATARKGFQIDTSANIYPIVAGTHTNNVGNLGNASYRFAGLYSELVNTNSLTIGSCVITWDSTAGMLKFSKGIYSQESVSALGASNSSATAATTLAQLTDTTISNPSNGQVLTYSGGKWVNSNVSSSIDQSTLNAALSNYVTKTGSGASGTWGINVSGTATGLAYKTLNGDDVDSTAGTFAFGGWASDYFPNVDYAGLQVSGFNDKFQIAANNGHLVFRQNDSGGSNTSWEAWKTLLDSANYTSYTVTKTGSGASGTWNININGNADTLDGYHLNYYLASNAAYFKLADITTVNSYSNEPITFDIKGRSSTYMCHVSIVFNNSTTTSHSLSSFTYIGDDAYGSKLHLYKITDTTWELWLTRTQTWDRVYISNLSPSSRLAFTPLATALEADALPTTYISTYDAALGMPSVKYVKFRNNANNDNAGYVGAGSTANNNIALMAYSGNNLLLGGNGTTQATFDGSKLELKGATSTPLKLKGNNSDSTWISFFNSSDTLIGYLGADSANGGLRYSNGSSYWNVLHTGNYTTYLNDVYVKKAGDTMTNTLNVSGNNHGFKIIGSSYSFGLHMGSGGTNRGIYQWAPTDKWLLYFDANNTILNHGNLNLTSGSIITNHGSSNHVNGASNAVINCNYTAYGAIFNAPVKSGRVSLNTYPSSDDNLNLCYFTSANISAGTNTISHRISWTADNGNLGIDIALPTTKLDVGGAVRGTNMVSTTTDGTAPFYASATTLCTNVNADLLDGWHKSEILGYSYIMTNSSLSSYWCKIWDATITNIGAGTERHMHLFIASEYQNLRGFLGLKIRQNGANDSGAYNFGVSLVVFGGNLPPSRFRLYYNNSTGYCALYGNVNVQWGAWNVKVFDKTGRYGEIKSIGTFYSTTFAAAQTLPSSSWIEGSASGFYVGTVQQYGHLYLEGANTSSSTSNTTQIIFRSSSSEQVAISSNNNALIINSTSSSTSGQIYLGVNGNHTILATTSSARVGIGEGFSGASGTSIAPQYKLHVKGTIYATGDVTALSDMRYKNVVKDIDVPIEDIAKLPVFDFTWKDKKDDLLHSGSSAQAIQKLFPHNVLGKDELSVNYGATGTIIGILVARGLIKLGDKTKDEITALKDEIVRLKHRIKILEEAA